MLTSMLVGSDISNAGGWYLGRPLRLNLLYSNLLRNFRPRITFIRILNFKKLRTNFFKVKYYLSQNRFFGRWSPQRSSASVRVNFHSK